MLSRSATAPTAGAAAAAGPHARVGAGPAAVAALRADPACEEGGSDSGESDDDDDDDDDSDDDDDDVSSDDDGAQRDEAAHAAGGGSFRNGADAIPGGHGGGEGDDGGADLEALLLLGAAPPPSRAARARPAVAATGNPPASAAAPASSGGGAWRGLTKYGCEIGARNRATTAERDAIHAFVRHARDAAGVVHWSRAFDEEDTWRPRLGKHMTVRGGKQLFKMWDRLHKIRPATGLPKCNCGEPP